jgi:hypothetical protein
MLPSHIRGSHVEPSKGCVQVMLELCSSNHGPAKANRQRRQPSLISFSLWASGCLDSGQGCTPCLSCFYGLSSAALRLALTTHHYLPFLTFPYLPTWSPMYTGSDQTGQGGHGRDGEAASQSGCSSSSGKCFYLPSLPVSLSRIQMGRRVLDASGHVI